MKQTIQIFFISAAISGGVFLAIAVYNKSTEQKTQGFQPKPDCVNVLGHPYRIICDRGDGQVSSYIKEIQERIPNQEK